MITGVRLGPLTERPFRLLWLGRTASSIGDALMLVGIAFAVLEVGGGSTWLGVVLGVSTLSRALVLVVGGVWADRLPRRLVMLGCDVVRGALDAAIAAALLTGQMRPWMFAVAGVAFGAAGAFFGPASTGLVPETVSPERLQQANALLGVSQNAARVFGPVASGAIVAAFGAAWVFAVDSASFAVSAAFLAALRVAPAAARPARRFVAEVVEGWREVRERRWLRAGFVVFALTNVGIAPFYVLGPVVAGASLDGARGWGAIMTGLAVGGLVGGVFAYRLHPSRPLVACFGVWLLAGLPVLAVAERLPLTAVVAAAVGLGLALAFTNALWETVLQREIPPGRLGRVAALDWTISLVFMPIGQVAAGPAAALVGTRTTLLAALVLVVVPALVLLNLRDVRELRGGPQLPARPATAGS